MACCNCTWIKKNAYRSLLISKSKIIVLSKLLNEKETNICPPSIGKKCINQKGFPRSFNQCFTPRIRYVLRALQYLNVSPNYTLIWQKEITEKNVNWNSFWMRSLGTKFFTLTRFPLFFFSLYKTFIYMHADVTKQEF